MHRSSKPGRDVRAGRIGEEARTYFDRFLDYRQLARYYLATCYERL